jgi:hypothetical protein
MYTKIRQIMPILLLSTLVFITLDANAQSLQPVSISIDKIGVGNNFDLKVTIKNGNTVDLNNLVINATFDPSILQLVIDKLPQIPANSGISFAFTEAGKIRINIATLPSKFDDDFNLNFNTLKSGNANLGVNLVSSSQNVSLVSAGNLALPVTKKASTSLVRSGGFGFDLNTSALFFLALNLLIPFLHLRKRARN